MNMEDFQEKMDPNHRTYLCRMLGLKELPDFLLVRYVQLKRMVDRIDAFLTPTDLAIIAIMAGAEDKVDNKPVEPLLDEAVNEEAENILEPSVEQPAEPAEQEQPDEGKAIPWSVGMPVNVLSADELKQGRIVGLYPAAEGSKGKVKITVEFEDGDIVTVEEDEVEAL